MQMKGYKNISHTGWKKAYNYLISQKPNKNEQNVYITKKDTQKRTQQPKPSEKRYLKPKWDTLGRYIHTKSGTQKLIEGLLLIAKIRSQNGGRALP